MERVAFLIEATNERIPCLLNPEDLIVRRTAGVLARQTSGGHLTGQGLADDPLLYTGGGRTEFTLNLLFDVSLAERMLQVQDVRQMTEPLWSLTEHQAAAEGGVALPLVRLLWGKYWNVAGVIVSISERLDQFDAGGVPRRSWIRLRMLRVQPPNPAPVAFVEAETDAMINAAVDIEIGLTVTNPDDLRTHEVTGSERLDQISARYYGSPRHWRWLALFNSISNPDDLQAGTILQIPPLP